MTERDCPSDATLRAFDAGDLAGADLERVAGHLETCPACERRLDALQSPNPVVDALRLPRRSMLMPTAVAKPSAAQPPATRLGPYKLLQKIGEGGMGAVWIAEQQAPVHRLVALKVIRADLDSAQAVARFESERQALALMDHPNIAKILDGGTTADGRPYFVMELVKGTPITKYCDEQRLTPRQRLELFVPVCRALQHAHQKGIIHRDIKPSNVLVAPYDGRPVIKVIDFGVAKATGQRLTERTLYTEFGSVVGTLEYMSPEQAELNNHDIDTRSDVYSLGVLLYELLTGTTPLTAERLKKTALLELLRAIREEEPPRPSIRLSDSKESLPSISAQRQTEPAKLRKLLRGELDWIVMKALEKDRSRRYETANGLARDIERYLNDEPVEACPPSTGYWLRKSLRRHKGEVAAVGGILAALVLGLIGTLIFAVGEAEQRRQADAFARLAKDEKQGAIFQAYRARVAAATAALQGQDVVEAAYELDAAPQPPRDWEWYHLHSRLDDSFALFRAPPGGDLLAISGPDGLRLVSRSGPDMWLCDEEGHPCLALPFHPQQILHLAAQTSRGVWVVDEEKPHVLRLLDGSGRVCLRVPGQVDFGVQAVALSPDQTRLAVSWDERPFRLAVYEVASGNEPAWSIERSKLAYGLAFSPDGTLLASAADDGKCHLWNAKTGVPIREFQAHELKAYHVAFRADGARLLTTSADGTVRQWDVRTGQPAELPFERHTGDVLTAVYSPDGKWIASAGADRTVRLWEAASLRQIAVLRGHTGPIQELVFSPDGRRLASASRMARTSETDHTVRLWKVDPEATLPVLHGHTSYIYPVAFSPDGRWLASGSWDKTIRLWDAATGEWCGELPHADIVSTMAFSPDGTWLVSRGDAEGGLWIWDEATAQLRKQIPVPGKSVRSIAVSPDGARIAATTWDWETRRHRVHVIDVATGREVFSEQGMAFAYSPDGQWLAGQATDEKTLLLRDARTYTVAARFAGHEDEIYSATFSPDSSLVASCSKDRTVRVWKIASGGCQVLRGHTDEVFTAAFHPGGTRLATGGRDQSIWLWDLATGEEVARLQGHANYIWSLAFSPDGATLASGSGDRTVRLWDTQPLAKRYRARQQAAALRPEADRLVERLFREKNDPAEVVAVLRADQALSEPLRQAALRAVLWRQRSHARSTAE